MTALNQQVLPTFFRPTGQLPCRFLSWGLGESLHTSVCVRFRLALFSAILASNTLRNKAPPSYARILKINHKQRDTGWHFGDACEAPADCLLLIRDTRLSEGPVGLLQAERDGSLKVIFVVSSQIDHIWNKRQSRVVSFFHPELPQRCKWNSWLSISFTPPWCFKRHLHHVGIITKSGTSFMSCSNILIHVFMSHI